MHETIHWWQHIESTFGLMLSLSHPTQVHANYTNFKKICARIGPKKSVLSLTKKHTQFLDPDSFSAANTIVNNHFDLDFFRLLTIKPTLASEIARNPLFDSVGHSLWMSSANILGAIQSTLDFRSTVIPDPKDWIAPFENLRLQRKRGYFHGSEIVVSPLGAFAIFEARFFSAPIPYMTTWTARGNPENKSIYIEDHSDLGFLSYLVSSFMPVQANVETTNRVYHLIAKDFSGKPIMDTIYFELPLVRLYFKTLTRDIQKINGRSKPASSKSF